MVRGTPLEPRICTSWGVFFRANQEGLILSGLHLQRGANSAEQSREELLMNWLTKWIVFLVHPRTGLGNLAALVAGGVFFLALSYWPQDWLAPGVREWFGQQTSITKIA